VRRIGEAAIQRDFRDQLAAAGESPAGTLDAQARQPLIRRLAVNVLEHSNEVEAAETRDFRQILERNVLAQMRMHVIAHALHSKRI